MDDSYGSEIISYLSICSVYRYIGLYGIYMDYIQRNIIFYVSLLFM